MDYLKYKTIRLHNEYIKRKKILNETINNAYTECSEKTAPTYTSEALRSKSGKNNQNNFFENKNNVLKVSDNNFFYNIGNKQDNFQFDNNDDIEYFSNKNFCVGKNKTYDIHTNKSRNFSKQNLNKSIFTDFVKLNNNVYNNNKNFIKNRFLNNNDHILNNKFENVFSKNEFNHLTNFENAKKQIDEYMEEITKKKQIKNNCNYKYKNLNNFINFY